MGVFASRGDENEDEMVVFLTMKSESRCLKRFCEYQWEVPATHLILLARQSAVDILLVQRT